MRIISIALVTVLSITIMSAQDGATLFKPCAACHSIGGGRMVGPDLKGITKIRTNEWLIKFIQSSTEMIKSGDPQAKAIFEEYNKVPMPNNNLTVDQVNQILTFIDGDKSANVIDPAKAALQLKVDSIIKINSPYDIDKGKALFNGELRFENGGASCASCHNVTYNKISNGGTIAKDLTKAFTRLNGFAGIKGIIGMPPFPAMTKAYTNNAITEIENAYLQLFLKSADAQNPTEPIVKRTWFLHLALTVGVLIAFTIMLLWFKRKRKSVNDSILKRQKKYSN